MYRTDTTSPIDSLATNVAPTLFYSSQIANSPSSSSPKRKYSLNATAPASPPNVPFEIFLYSNYPIYKTKKIYSGNCVLKFKTKILKKFSYRRNCIYQRICNQIRSHIFDNVELSGAYFWYRFFSDAFQFPIETFECVFEH